MVNTIKSSLQGTTIFTTHSMSEAEKLCSKTVIMGKGRVLEFDLISKLKQRYFSCCWVDIRVSQGDQEEKKKHFVREQILTEGIKQVGDERGLLTFQIQKGEVKLSELLGKVQQMKLQHLIESYSFSEPRLEDVYIKVTREDRVQEIEMVQTNTEEPRLQ